MSGPKLVVGLPLGLGKANHIINALYAPRPPTCDQVDHFSALTLEKPRPKEPARAAFPRAG